MSIDTKLKDGKGGGYTVEVLNDNSISTSDKRKNSITQSSNTNSDEFGYRKKVDVASSITTYVGYAKSTEGDDAPIWQIYRIIVSGNTTITEYAENNPRFELKWQDRSTYSYGAVLPTFVNDYSLLFDGVDEYIEAPDDSSLDITGDISISAWIKPATGSNGTTRAILSKWNGSGNQRAYLFRVNSSNNLDFITSVSGNSGSNETATGITTINENQWQHVAVTYKASTATYNLYINGALDATVVGGNNSIFNSSSALLVAATRSGTGSITNLFDGHIDEVSLWNIELSSTNIVDIYNLGTPSNLASHVQYVNLVTWYRCGDDDVYPTIEDNVGSNNATMNNMEEGDIQVDTP